MHFHLTKTIHLPTFISTSHHFMEIERFFRAGFKNYIGKIPGGYSKYFTGFRFI